MQSSVSAGVLLLLALRLPINDFGLPCTGLHTCITCIRATSHTTRHHYAGSYPYLTSIHQRNPGSGIILLHDWIGLN
ncbi:hypothetical protein BDV11DRAFT_71597 [Aspergillus similis]